MQTTVKIEDKDGEVISVGLLYESKDVVIAHIETKTKHLEDDFGLGDLCEILIGNHCSIEFENLPFSEPMTIIECGKYNLRVAIYNRELLEQYADGKGGQELYR